MEPSCIPIPALLFILLFFHVSHITAQSNNTNTTHFSCPTNSASCITYVVYRAQAPEFMDLGHISGLFSVSRLSMMRASNLPSDEVTLHPDQILLVPITCGCTGNQSFANISYQIKSGDSFYWVSIHHFENLTDYHVVEEMNPTLEPTKLKVGQEVVFPLYCKCPTRTDLDRGLNLLLTYVWQPGDDLHDLSKLMNTTVDAVVNENNYRNFSAAMYFPILVPVSQLPILPQPLYPDQKSGSHSRTITIIVGMVAAALLLASLSFYVFVYRNCYHKKALVPTGSILETHDLLACNTPYNYNDVASSSRIKGDKLLVGVSEYLDKPVVYEAKAILEATMNLDERYSLGGSVYRATIGGEVFAVKQAKGDVTEEVQFLQKVNHANLIKLIGVSSDTDGYFFLVYEFAENGSLDKWLYPKQSSSSSGTLLSWRQRLNIALDIANGLQYMHEHTIPSIVHGNIRASTILLNAQFKAKISNFSVAKHTTVSITPSVDVFAFGVVILELLSGRRAMASREGGEVGVLWKEIRMILGVEEKRAERLKKWMDPNMEGLYPTEGALSLAALARACTSDVSLERPSMAEIVFNLSVLAQSCSDEFERPRHSNSEEHVPIMNPVSAR